MGTDPLSRRDFLHTAATVAAAAGLVGCQTGGTGAANRGVAGSIAHVDPAAGVTDRDMAAILFKYRQSHNVQLTPDKIHGVEFIVDDAGAPTINVLVTEAFLMTANKEEIDQLKQPLPYTFEGKQQVEQLIPVTVEARPLADASPGTARASSVAAQVCMGADCDNAAVPTNGTVGWNIVLRHDGKEVPCFVTALHAVSSVANGAPAGQAVRIAGHANAGTIDQFVKIALISPIGLPPTNRWDFATVKYTGDNVTPKKCILCDVAYPQRFSTKVATSSQITYHKTGQGSNPPCRSTSTLKGMGDITFTYGVGSAVFQCQLIFDKFTEPSDSGAVIVRSDDTGTVSVTGLIMGSSGGYTIANPIYLFEPRPLRHWTYIGASTSPATIGLPIYQQNNTLAQPAPTIPGQCEL